MEISYWISRWKKNKTGWHMNEVYPHLKTYWHRLGLKANASVFVPLCGKSLDVHWLTGRGHRVIGIDVSEIAIHQCMQHSNQTFERSAHGSLVRYRSTLLDLWAGDFFKLKPEQIPKIEAVYDKAALISQPRSKRKNYASKIRAFCSADTQIFLNTFEYKEVEMSGPPFPVFREELDRYYGDRFTIRLLHEESIFDELPGFQRRGLSSYLLEKVYLMGPRKIKSELSGP